MTVTKAEQSVRATYTVELSVEDVPIVKASWHKYEIQPQRILLIWKQPQLFRNGPWSTVVFGRRVLMGGGLGKDERKVEFYSPGERPDWLNELVDEYTPNWHQILRETWLND